MIMVLNVILSGFPIMYGLLNGMPVDLPIIFISYFIVYLVVILRALAFYIELSENNFLDLRLNLSHDRESLHGWI